MADADEFVTAVGPNGQKRRVPKHYLDNPAFGFRLPPSALAARTDEEGEAVTPISGATVPADEPTPDATETPAGDTETTAATPATVATKKEGRREGSR